MSPSDIRKLAGYLLTLNSDDDALVDANEALHALAELVEACPQNLRCEDFNHAGIGNYHKGSEPCPPLVRYHKALAGVEIIPP